MAGKLLFIADMLGQMADRKYLERLLLLFKEYEEGYNETYKNEFELLEKTIGFYEQIMYRLVTEMGYKPYYMQKHFIKRWGINKDIYAEAVAKNITYLKQILSNTDEHRSLLKRGGIVARLNND